VRGSTSAPAAAERSTRPPVSARAQVLAPEQAQGASLVQEPGPVSARAAWVSAPVRASAPAPVQGPVSARAAWALAPVQASAQAPEPGPVSARAAWV